MKQDWTRREHAEPDRFHYPIFVYYGLAVKDCRGPELLRHVKHDHNHTWTHWQAVDLSRTPIPRPPNAAGEVRRNAVTSTGLLADESKGETK